MAKLAVQIVSLLDRKWRQSRSNNRNELLNLSAPEKFPTLRLTSFHDEILTIASKPQSHSVTSARVLVTGGAGFLGARLCSRLVATGKDVLCVDNFYSGNKANVAHLMGNPLFELIRHDVTFPLYVEVDEIYNLACPASPPFYQSDPVQTTKTSVHGAINMLGLAKRVKAKILQASTSEVYGDPEQHPQHEDYCGRVNPIGRRACYDEGKRCAETLFFDYQRQHGLDIKIARIFNTYGPGMHPNDGRVVSNFIVEALTNKPITIYGDGSQTRSFCYVDDLIDALIRLMDLTEPGFAGPVNLGNPDEVMVGSLANTILELTGSSSKIQFEPIPDGDPRRRRPDIGLARATLGWQPTTNLQSGLTKTIDYFAESLNLPANLKQPQPGKNQGRIANFGG